jgi:hypothetical protein
MLLPLNVCCQLELRSGKKIEEQNTTRTQYHYGTNTAQYTKNSKQLKIFHEIHQSKHLLTKDLNQTISKQSNKKNILRNYSFIPL